MFFDGQAIQSIVWLPRTRSNSSQGTTACFIGPTPIGIDQQHLLVEPIDLFIDILPPRSAPELCDLFRISGVDLRCYRKQPSAEPLKPKCFSGKIPLRTETV